MTDLDRLTHKLIKLEIPFAFDGKHLIVCGYVVWFGLNGHYRVTKQDAPIAHWCDHSLTDLTKILQTQHEINA
jgi:hypothetical protein